MTQAPEIYQKPIDDIDVTGLPLRGTESFDQALITRYALEYAGRGWAAIMTVDNQFIRVVAVPEHGIEPKDYVLGLLKHGFLEDALPILEALSGMIDDADIEYNLGICLSELGRIDESVAPLEKCIALDPNYVSGLVGLGVAYVRLYRLDEAEAVLRNAIRQEPHNAYAKRNLAVVLTKIGKLQDALPLFRQAASLMPQDLNVQLGLAQCLTQLGGAHRTEADTIYKLIVEKFREHPAAELAVAARNKMASEDLHAKVDGKVRMDAVFYMQSDGRRSPAHVLSPGAAGRRAAATAAAP
ncbi:MAG: tetratricopeptide repeat protein [Gammaproteobacteria bacterium]|nr:tetratricopeptide repeat protein [Gammaproteobacteria bacterium]